MAPRSGRTVTARALHPGAWWLWAIGIATAAARTTNPVLLLLSVAVVWHVVSARRSSAPWSRAFALFVKLGLLVVLVRVLAQVLFGPEPTGTVLLDLPRVPLPDWAAGVTLGGPIGSDALAAATVEGLRLATMLACVGAANALANAKRLLASVPTALYELGVAVVVALSFAPALALSVRRIRAARRLRGRPDRGVRSLVGVAMPVLEDALDRALTLAAAMDSRGYGRRAAVAPRRRRLTALLSLVGLGGITLGVYGLLDGSGPSLAGLPALVAGVLAAVAGLHLGASGSSRTRYRPDPWWGAEWATAVAGLAAGLAMIAGGLLDPGAVRPPILPLTDLPLPLLPVVGLALAALPAWVTPPPVDSPPRPAAAGVSPHRSGAGATR